jgi:hypothetical protein
MRKNTLNKINGQASDVLNVQGRMTRGYGIIPKMVMQDKRLSLDAKGIYSYFCSYAGAGTTAFPGRAKILRDLCIGEERYYHHFNLLKKYGYISVEQKNGANGRFKHNVYTLVEMVPLDQPPSPSGPQTGPGGSPTRYPENKGEDPSPQEPYPDFPGTVDPDTGGGGFNNNNPCKINNYTSNSQGQRQSQGQNQTPQETLKETPQEKTDMTPTHDSDRDATVPATANIKSQNQAQGLKEKTVMMPVPAADVSAASETSLSQSKNQDPKEKTKTPKKKPP